MYVGSDVLERLRMDVVETTKKIHSRLCLLLHSDAGRLMKRICICGKVFKGEDPWCSDRCEYIVERMKSPMGQKMDVRHAFKFFGTQWDRKHGKRG